MISKLKTERFIASRLSVNGHSSRVMSRVATLSVAVSITVMIIALSVVAGFRATIADTLSGMGADILVSAPEFDTQNSGQEPWMRHDTSLVAMIVRDSEVSHIERYASKSAIMRGDSTMLGVMLKGIGSDHDTSFISKQMIRGTIPTYCDSTRSRKVLISNTIAQTMGLDTASRFELLFVAQGSTPRRERLEVEGIYSSGMEEFDKALIIGDIAIVQRINNWQRDQISGYEITLAAGADPEIEAEMVDDIIYEYNSENGDISMINQPDVTTLSQNYSQLLDWLDMLGLNTTIIVIIMTIVAAINMICGVLIIVLEQTRTIGVLKALGTPNSSLRTIFVLRSSTITLKGILWGNLLGLGLCLMQSNFGLLTLDPDSYMVSTVPVLIDPLSIITLSIGTMAIITTAMIIPTMIISRISPSQSIRFS